MMSTLSATLFEPSHCQEPAWSAPPPPMFWMSLEPVAKLVLSGPSALVTKSLTAADLRKLGRLASGSTGLRTMPELEFPAESGVVPVVKKLLQSKPFPNARGKEHVTGPLGAHCPVVA